MRNACGAPPASSRTLAGGGIRIIRGEQSLNIISHAAFVGVDHPGRAFLALTVFFRHVGLAAFADDELSPHVRELANLAHDRPRPCPRRTMRVAYLVSGAMPGVLPIRRSSWSAAS